MASERVYLEGLSECKAALRQLPDSTAKNVLKRVLKKRGQPVADRAKSLVRRRTGALGDSITVSDKLSPRQKRLHKRASNDPHLVEMFVGPGPHPHAHLQEFQSNGKPFMRPAWDAERMGVFTGIKADLWEEISKAAARLAKKAAKAAKAGK